MFDCPSCGSKTPRLIIFTDPHKLGCDSCGIRKPRARNVNLGQVVERWSDVSKKGVERNHKITTGKAWEIEHRTLAEDGKTVINSVTGKEAQY